MLKITPAAANSNQKSHLDNNLLLFLSENNEFCF